MNTKLLLLSSLLFFCLTNCQDRRPAKTSDTGIVEGVTGERLDSLLTPYLIELRRLTDNETGLAIGITQGDQIIYAKTFGYANLEKEIVADFNTVFHIASVSKPFTAAAISKLIQQEKLQLDDRLVDHLPEFKMQGTGYDSITIRHILTHTSGIPRHVSSGDWENPSYGPKALEENLMNVQDFQLDFSPGTQFSYSNSAFDLLGIVIHRTSGMPFESYVQEHILKPTGMIHSFYKKPKDSLPPDWALPYSYGIRDQEWTPYPYTEKYFPSSGLQTTLPDLCRWGMLHLNEGRSNDTQVLAKEYFDLLVSPQYETPWGDQIGLSWFLQSYLERPIIMHTGNDTGFEAILYIYPEEDISISVLANRDFSRTGRIINAASEVLFDEIPKDYTVSAKYLFAQEYRTAGIAAADALWQKLKQDTTDQYYTSDDDILTTGAVLENGQHWNDAQEILKYYLSINDQSTYAWRLLGNTYLNLSDTSQAISCYEKTLEINPEYEKGRFALEQLSSLKE